MEELRGGADVVLKKIMRQAVEDRWRQRRLTQKSEEALDRLLEEVFDDEQDD